MDGEKNAGISPINGQPVPINPNGRPRGKPNKATTKFKEALNKLFEDNADQMMLWLAEVKDPKDRFDILAKFADFLYPKLARNTVQQTVDVKIKSESVDALDRWLGATGGKVIEHEPRFDA